MNGQQDPSCTPRTRIPSRRPPSRPLSSQVHPDRSQDGNEPSASSPILAQRSTSLTTAPTTAIQPRMAQLETLEAKMASIEVSLSNAPRRKKNGSVTGSVTSSVRSSSNKDAVAVKELENLRNALKDKENIIQDLKGQLCATGLKLPGRIKANGNVFAPPKNGRDQDAIDDVDRKRLEERLNRLRTDTDNKRLIIKKLKMALERLDVTDNIDVRIQQAELEYQVGREELNLLTLLEEARTLQICLEESNKKTAFTEQTFYSCLSSIDGSKSATLHAVDLTHDPKTPNFGAGPRDKETQGLWIDWTLENTGLRKGDRLVEVNGKVVLRKCREDLVRLLAADPDPARIVVLRKGRESVSGGRMVTVDSEAGTAIKELVALRSELEVVRERAEEAQRAKDGLRSDNIRLTHRISYLEEQVSELLNKKGSIESDIRIVTGNPIIASTVKSHHNVTNINITSQSATSAPTADVQVFQKGPQVTTLVQNINENGQSTVQLPMRSKSSLSNVSVEQPMSIQKISRQRHKYRNNNSIRSNAHNDYDVVSGNNNSVMEQSYKKATKIVQDLTKNGDYDSKHKPACYENPHNVDILKHYNARKSSSVLDFRSEVRISPRCDSRSIETLENITLNAFSKRLYKKHDVRSVKSLDFDSDCNGIPKNGTDSSRQQVYDKPRPMPPKKPIRLSLHRAQSAQSVETPAVGIQDIISIRKPTKRNYKSEILNGKETAWATSKYAPHKLDNANSVRLAAETASWC